MEPQEDGQYPRLNAAMLNSSQFSGKIVSLVGRVQSFDGTTLQLQCADHGTVVIHAGDAEFHQPTGTNVELIGLANEDNTVLLFVTRQLTNDFDLDIYNKMLQVQHNPNYAHYFQ